MNETALYSIEGLQFYYSGNKVLDVHHLDLEQGKIHVFLGPNGSGKTTLLKILNRLFDYPSGAVLFKGKSIKGNDDVRNQTVYVHQDPLMLTGSVYDNIAYGLKFRKRKAEEIRRTVVNILSTVGLEDCVKRKSTALSGGEKQRVAIARALALRPDALLLDEPTSSVDKENIGRIEEILIRIKEEYGCTVLVSTHNLPFAYRICDSLIHLEEGCVKPPSENILKGKVARAENHHIVFKSGNLSFLGPLIDGSFSTAVIDFDHIYLSNDSVETSARNRFKGEITGLKDSKTGCVIVDVASEGNVILSVSVLDQTVSTMDLCVGKKMWLAFKASSVRFY